MKTNPLNSFIILTILLLTGARAGLPEETFSTEQVKSAADFANITAKGDSEAFVKTFSATIGLPAALAGHKLANPLLAKRNNIILWQDKPDDLLYSSKCFGDLYTQLILQGAAGKRIFGGRPAAPSELNSCVAVGSDSEYFCTGTLIAKRLVLTAGHCFQLGREPTRVLVGNSTTTGGTTYKVKQGGAIQHSQYQQNSAPHNDLTLLILETDVAAAEPAKLAKVAQCDGMQSVRIAGFGTTDATGRLGFGTKRIADVVVVSPDGKKCDGQLYGADPDLEFVAEDQRSDTCNGDSGGPAYLKTATGEWLLAGATSRPTINSRMPCGDGGIYVRTAKYVPWITQTAAANNVSFP